MSHSDEEPADVEGSVTERPSALRGTAARASAIAEQLKQTQDERWAAFAADEELLDPNYRYENDHEGLGLGLVHERSKAKKEKKERAPGGSAGHLHATTKKERAGEAKQGVARQAPLFASQAQSQRLDVEAMLRKLDANDESDDVDAALLSKLLNPQDGGDSESDLDNDDTGGEEKDIIQSVLFGGRSRNHDAGGGDHEGADGAGVAVDDETPIPIASTKKENVLIFHSEDQSVAAPPRGNAARGTGSQRHAGDALPSHSAAGATVGAGGVKSEPNFVGGGITAAEELVVKQELKFEDDADQLPGGLQPLIAGDGSESQVFWFDAKEHGYGSSMDAGSVALFGKFAQQTNRGTVWHSCCVRVRNIQRCVLILPKEGATEASVVDDINRVCRTARIDRRRIKAVERYYAFEEPGVQRERATWLKLRYPASFPPFPSQQLRTAQFVAGANRSLLELFLIKRELMGPSLLTVRDLVPVPPEQRISHCAFEFIVDDPKKVSPHQGSTAPRLTAASVQLCAQLDASGAKNEVFAVALTVCRDVDINGGSKRVPPCKHFVAVRPFDKSTPLPLDLESFCRRKNLACVRQCDSELALLQWLLDRWREVDPDIIVGHNFTSYTLDVLLHRLHDLRVANWSLLGRLVLRQMPKLQSGAGGTRDSTYQEREACIGRLICDTYLLAREYFKSTNYKLLHLARLMGVDGVAGPVTQQQAEESMTLVTRETLLASQGVFDLCLQALNGTALALGVAYHIDVIPLTKRLCSLAGTLWSRTLNGSRAERIEYLLMHAFHKLKFVTPDKKQFGTDGGKKHPRDDVDADVAGAGDEEEDGKKRAKYKGGMVLEPKRGLYTDYVLLLDFNSLYPSLIQEFNICFTTVARGAGVESDIPDQQMLVCAVCAAAGAPAPCPHRCVLPKVIANLVQRRREVKRLMKSERDESQREQLNIRQLALKLTANSMYGCLGFEHSRFYAQPLAELVTRQGRQALQNTVDLVPTINASLSVIYGDTDSVMIQTGIHDNLALVREMADKIKVEVNKRYRSLEIDIDGVFRAILLSRKKKYAALSVLDFQGAGTQLKKEVKGLDMVRRDWCPLVKRCCNDILDKLLGSDAAGADAVDFVSHYMQGVAMHVRRGDRFELNDFVVSKSLTKEPEHYKGSSFPHAAVAMRMKERNEPVRVGDLIPYVICEAAAGGDNDASSAKLSARAFHVDEVKRAPQRLDAEWYLETQIFPPVMRLCEVVDGFSAAHLAEVMGLKAHPTMREEEAEHLATVEYSAAFRVANLEECFPRAEVFQLLCPRCQKMTVIQPHRRVEALLAEQPSPALHPPFHLYECHECRGAIPIAYLTNNLVMLCNRYIRRFYAHGGTTEELLRLRQQIGYFRALLDVPHMPGVRREVREMHRSKALRCVDADNQPCTASAADIDDEVLNPPLEYVKMVYNAMDGLSVDLARVTSAFHLRR